jgi:Pvc16 N-terminal domain
MAKERHLTLATYHAIAATGQAIVGLLKDASANTEFADSTFELYQAGDFQSGPPLTEGISVFLYRVAVSASRRNLPPSTGTNGRRFRSPLPLDLYYLVTPWGKTAAKQQRLLGWAVRQLQDTPVLPAGLLNHYGPEADTFRSTETVELICETMTLQDMVNILDPVKSIPQLSMVYVARMVVIESMVELIEADPAQTRVFDYVKDVAG